MLLSRCSRRSEFTEQMCPADDLLRLTGSDRVICMCGGTAVYPTLIRPISPKRHVKNERKWHGAETTVHTDMSGNQRTWHHAETIVLTNMSGMNERGTVPKPLSILTCQQ